MHELFITAAIPSPKVAEVLQVLALYTHTRPAQFFRRKVEFKGMYLQSTSHVIWPTKITLQDLRDHNMEVHPSQVSQKNS